MNEDELLLFLRGIIAEMLGEESGNSETDEKMKAE